MTDKLKEAAENHAAEYYESGCPDEVTLTEDDLYENRKENFISGATSPEAEEYWRGKYNAKVIAFLEAHLKWEADLINEDKFWWPNADKDTLRGPIYDKFLDLQQMRNELLAMFRKEKNNV